MLDRQERTRRFWRYANAYGFEDKDLSQPSDGAEECQNVDPNLLAFVTFAREVGIEVPNDHGDKTIFESFTIIQEQMRWETQFVDLAQRLDVDVRYKNSDELEERTCAIKHRDVGFEDQEVYVWYGNYKGKFARVKQMNGSACLVELETPRFGESSVAIEGQDLLAYVSPYSRVLLNFNVSS